RMIEGLRDTGYQFNTAIADIVDNSIAAKATKIEVFISMDFKGDVRLSVVDNGEGMNREGLLNAMKYGSAKRANAASLGKFGLGLKTASTAFCKKLSVLSRASSSDIPLEVSWDLEHVKETNKWELLFSQAPDKDSLIELDKISLGKSGTVVLWTKIDRLLKKEYKTKGGRDAQNAIKKLADNLREHIGMVYQRFLDPSDSRAQNLIISVNGIAAIAWDPFCTGESEILAQQTLTAETESGHQANFTVKAFVLPRKEEFSSEDAFKKAQISNETQGIYIYRENRLIHEADWLDMYSKEPHGSLLRVEFSFNYDLDEAFHIDIKKSQIILNDQLWEWLKNEFLTAPRREANNRYRLGQKSEAHKKASGSHDTSNRNIASKEEDIQQAMVTVNNAATGDVTVTNKLGTFKLKLPVESARKPGELYIQIVDSLPDGALFRPSIIDMSKAVQINSSHPYYHKVYIPNLKSGVTIQGMDALLWSLCVAELSTISDSTSKYFEEMRFEISRILRKLVEDLPEPEINDNVGS
ncbi:MAG: ATP-binding protein, partial [Bacteroidota bacterium]|nr:ATP-binding protein [Bacteroidota bacterium]